METHASDSTHGVPETAVPTGNDADDDDLYPADMGDACTENAECQSGYCVHGKNGDQCSTTCIDNCPTGWTCKQFAPQDSDIFFVCVPMHVTVCRPCEDSAVCAEGGYQDKAFCYKSGDNGNFCATPCSGGVPCPDGYDCADVEGPGGTTAACVPTSGQCECDEVAQAQGLSTTCSVTNEIGVCTGERACGAAGLSACNAGTPAPEECNGIDDNCDGVTDEGAKDCDGDGLADCVDPDMDGDGVLEDGDGNGEPGSHPCKPGQVDGCDDNCAGCWPNPGQADANGDGTGDACEIDADKDGFTPGAGDCDDNNALVNPAAPEKCNGVDDDCDDVVDNEDAAGCKTWYMDADADGFGVETDFQCLCGAVGDYSAKVTGDCNDELNTVYPGALEVCDGNDNDCDGIVDPAGAPGCIPYYFDGDSDEYGFSPSWKCACGPDGTFSAPEPGDCDDDNASIHPNALELCDSLDNDCNGETDEAAVAPCTSDCGAGTQPCVDGQPGECDAPKLKTCLNGDKDCAEFTTCGECPPPKAEVCNDKDDNCNGVVDEDVKNACGACGPVPAEVCDGKDNNCDGQVDEGVKTTFFMDGDGDKYGDPGNTVDACEAPGTMVAQGGDCNDEVPSIHEGADEICNGIDENCDGKIDEPWPKVGTACDGDDPDECTDGVWTCLAAGTDVHCVDPDDPLIETCNGADDNCDGVVDPENSAGCETWYQDGDKDGFGGTASKCLCGAADDFSTLVGGDCNDGDKAINEDAAEVCNGKDDNCNGKIDDEDAIGCQLYFEDADSDGYGTTQTKCLCAPGPVYKALKSLDCNDQNKNINPDATEACGGGDENCDDVVDGPNSQGCTPHYVDGDNDNYGGPQSACLCAPSGQYKTTNSGDCNDSVWAINPQASEQCNNQDDNCNFQVDEGNPGGGGACSVPGETGVCAQGQLQCQGGNLNCQKTQFGSSETCNGKDDNCDGQVDGMTQGCSNSCGSGTKTCNFGSWGNCSAPTPQCTSGSCCDGCNYRPSSYKCSSSPYSTTKACQSNSCGTNVLETKKYKYCTGSSSSCGTGNLKSSTTTYDDCKSSERCVTSGSNAYCSSCSKGCKNNACIKSICGNGTCESDESPKNCTSDCGPVHQALTPALYYKNDVDDDKLSCSSGLSTWWHYGSAGANKLPSWVWVSNCGLPSASNPTSYAGYNARWKFTVKKAGSYLIDTWIPSSNAACGFSSSKFSSSVRYNLKGPGVAKSVNKSQKSLGSVLTLWSSVTLQPGDYTVYLYDSAPEGCACNSTCSGVSHRVFADGAGVTYK